MRNFCRSNTDFIMPLLIVFAVIIASCGGGGSDNKNPTPIPDNPDINPDQNQPLELGVTINSINTEECPNVKVYVSVYDENNQVIEDDPALSLKVIEDGVEATGNLDLTWLTVEGNALSVVLAMDYSLSMVNLDNNEDEMKRAVREFVALMKPEDKAAIVKFYYTPQVMVGPTSDKDALNNAIDAPPTSNMYTNIYDTIFSAVDLLAAETGPVAVILISDGGHTMTQVEGFLPPEEYAVQDGLTIEGHTKDEALTHAIDNNVPVYTIGYKSTSTDHEEIKEIAARTGAGYYSATDAGALQNIYGSLFTSLEGNQHQVVYPSNTADALEHTIRIEAQYNELLGSSDDLASILCPAP